MALKVPDEHPFAEPHAQRVNPKLDEAKGCGEERNKDDVPYRLAVSFLQRLGESCHLEHLSDQALHSSNRIEGLNNQRDTC